MIGETISHYKILEKLGGGGMGVVYKAEDTKLERFVALKFLPPELVRDEETKKRFIREAQAASALDHSNICTIYEISETSDLPDVAGEQLFIVMGYYQGKTLQEKIRQAASVDKSNLSINESLEIAIQIASGLQNAHEKGIVHRDIKPANIIVTDTGIVKIVDFGLAKLIDQTMITRIGSTVGTAAYMSPEQAVGDKLDHRTDIWSLGVIMYEMITGQRPFRGEYEQALIYTIINNEPEPIQNYIPDIPADLVQIINRSLEKNQDYRYSSVTEMLKDLKNNLYGLQPGEQEPFNQQTPHHAIKKPRKAVQVRLAVLPFINLSGDPEQEYLSDGLTQEMITQLGRLHPQSLGVIARTSVMRYKKSDIPIDQIGRELKVDYVLEGSTRREGSRVRISADLINVRDQMQLWGDIFERDLSGILILQNEVAEKVAEALAIKLLPSEQARLAKVGTVNPEAYDAYLKGQYHWDSLGKEDLEKAMEYFNIAIEKDPNWAPPYAGLAEAWGGSMQMGFVPPTVALPKIYQYLNKALELDPNSANSHYVKAIIAVWVEWDWEKGETEFLRSIELNSNNALCRIYYAHLLMIMKRSDEALHQANLALELDPMKPLVMALYGVVMMNAGDYQSAIIQNEKALSIEPGHFFATAQLEFSSYFSGDYERAFEAAKQILQFEDKAISAIDKTYNDQGYFPALRVMISNLEKLVEGGLSSPWDLAAYYLRLKEYDKALYWLERGYEIHNPNMPYITTVFFDDDQLKDNPRFIELLKKMKLPVHGTTIKNNTS